MITVGTCFLMPHPDGKVAHLWVVVAMKDDTIVVVNFNSQRDGSDTTTILDTGDHPFIKRPTVVTYTDSIICSKSNIEELLKSTNSPITLHSDCPAATLKKIKDGLITSDFTPMKVIRFCQTI